jgi:dinuclear metal center YbgI/SA1388 family protein
MPTPRRATDICRELDDFLEVGKFNDASLNGLQLDAGAAVEKVVCGVSANAALIAAAAEAGAQLIVVHHGFLWGRCERLTSIFGARVGACFAAGVSVAGYHLPLDAHSKVGNNAGLVRLLNLQGRAPFADYRGNAIGWRGELPTPTPLAQLAATLERDLGGLSHCFGDPDRLIRSVGVCSGGAAEVLTQAADAGLDLYLTGEAEEWTQAQALELGVAFIAGGHHRTERFGPRALAAHLRDAMHLDAEFIDVDNPV